MARAIPSGRRRAGSPASHGAEAIERAERERDDAVGGANAAALAAAAKGDGTTFVRGSPRSRAHVRQPPPAPPSTSTDGPRIRPDVEYTPVLYGRPADAIVSSGASELRKLPAVYAVTETDELFTSHDPTTWEPIALHEGQERDYRNDVGERLKVQSIAARLVPEFMLNTNPDALNGPPVVDVDAMVLGGNGRTMGLRLAYQAGRAQAYRALLVERSDVFGIARAGLDRFKAPMLIRVVDVDASERADLSRRLNEGQTQEKRATVDAASLARRLSPSTLSILSRDNASDATLRAFLSSPASRSFVGALVADGIIERRTMSKLLTADGAALTDDGKTLVERALTAWAIPEVATVDALGEHRRDLIARVVPALASADRAGHDLVGIVRSAAEQVREADARGSTPDALAQQSGLFAAMEVRPAALALARELHGNRRRFVELVRGAATAALDAPTNQGDMFGSAVDVDALITRAAEAHTPKGTTP